MKTTIQNMAAATVLTALLWAAPAAAQDNLWTGGVGGNWTDGTWNQFGPPDPTFDARGVIGSSVGSGSPTGVVNVTSDIRASNPSSSVVLGDGAGTSGTLNISSSGALRVALQGVSTGDFDVGLGGGIGVLNITSGTLEVEGALRSTAGQSSDTMIALTGTASLTANSANLDRALRIDGSGIDFSVTNNLVLGLAGTHTWVIPAGGPSTVLVGGNVDLGGTLRLEFPDGTPTVGSTWNLIDATTVDANEAVPSGFSFVDTSAVGGLGPGERFATQTVASGASVNGMFAQLVLEQHPALLVDRDTGEVSIYNPGSVASIAFDTYVVGSPTVGALNPANWTSIAPADGWFQANPGPNQLSELNPEGTGSVAADSEIELGAVFNRLPPASFGQENEDITFRYAKPDGGFIDGQVIYLGIPNDTLTLNVDPDTGAAQILNGTGFTVAIDTYAITSASGSLRFADGNPADTWNSLQDQGASGGNWFEANSDAGQLSELLVSGGLELGPDAVVNLGSPFNDASGLLDLNFQFSILESAAGDFNGDGLVNAADYVLWRNHDGDADDSVLGGNGDEVAGVGAGDYELWKLNYGNSNSGDGIPQLLTGKVVYSALVSPGGGSLAASTSAVPEPGTLALFVLSALLATFGRRWAC